MGKTKTRMIKIASTKESVSVYDADENNFYSSTASADFIADHWFINRVLVNPKSHRGKGIGTQLLQTLIKEIRKHDNNKIIVTPGGYENDQERQNNFYLKNGFVQEKDFLSYV